MRLDEITKDEFKQRLSDPVLSEIITRYNRVKNELPALGFVAELDTEYPPKLIVRRDEKSGKDYHLSKVEYEVVDQAFMHPKDKWLLDYEVNMDITEWEPEKGYMEYTFEY